MPKFKVEVEKTLSKTYTRAFEVEADDQDAAETEALELADNGISDLSDWEDDGVQPPDEEHSISNVEELK